MKLAVVTGARRGIGLAIAKTLHAEGYSVLIAATSAESDFAPELENLRQSGFERTNYVSCDISSPKQRKALFDKVEKEYGRLDILVNNAGVAPAVRMDILETTEESVDRLLNINLKGTFFMCQMAANLMIACLKHNLEDYCPRIVNISSVSAYTSSPNRGEYCISKAGVSMVTLLFADKLAEHGIGVFEVRPGIIMTDMTAPVKEKYETLIAEGITPIRRFGTPDDVANCMLAICRGHLDFATGQVLNADGGFHIRRL